MLEAIRLAVASTVNGTLASFDGAYLKNIARWLLASGDENMRFISYPDA
jgi:hypothetical protein